jgi:hypothetical protein
MAVADKPTVHLSLSTLRKEVAKPDAFRVALSGSKVITFPDLFALESTEAEEVFGSLGRNATNWTALDKWLSKTDATALRAEKLSVRELAAVVQAAISYYEGTVGSAEKDTASES